MSDEAEEPRSRAKWVGVVLIVLALAALAWQAWEGGFADEPPPDGMPTGSVGQPSLKEMLARLDAARLGVEAAASAAAAAAAKPPMGAGEIEICGIGAVQADESGQPRDMAPIQLATQAARERLLPALLRSGDETQRAAGLLLQSVDASPLGDATPSSQVLARDMLASMALSTRSPQVYAWAMRACQNDRGQGMCQLLSADQWARLEPGNAVAWLQVAVDAQARNDVPAVAEAMFRASHATRADTHWGTLAGTALAHLPTDTPLLSKGALAEELMGAEAAVATPHLIASQYCAEADVRDANRRQTCAAVAEVLQARGTSLTDAGMAAALGERVGWPAERVELLRDERDAVLQVYTQRAAAVRERWGCAALDQTARRLVEVSQQGEIAVMRRTLREQTDSAAVLAQRYREAAAKPAPGSASGGVSVAIR